MTGRRADAAVAALLTFVLLVALAPAWARPESVFDEGFALAYGVRVLEGDLPHRDFVSFYGPGNPWLLAGAFALGGADQETERVLGALYRLLIVLGAAAVAATGGRVAAAAAGLLLVPLLLRMGFAAYAAFGALGLALVAVALLVHARGSPARLAGAGLAAGACALIRPEFALAAAIAMAPLLPGTERKRLIAAGAALPLLALVVHFALVGPDRLDGVVEDLRASGDGRRLPFDPFGSGVADRVDGSRAFVLVVVLAVGVVAAAIVRRRRDGALALGLLALGLIPYVLSRLDYSHAVVALIPAVAAVPAAVGGRRGPVLAFVALLAVLLLSAPTMVDGYVRRHANLLLGRLSYDATREVVVAGRSFVLDPVSAGDVQRVVDAAEAQRRSGARTLFVGPRDLRRSNANDAFLYYLLRDLEPASRYMELNPWTANRPGSGLARDLAGADLLVLNDAWDRWNEPNDSDRLGPAEPNEVVERRFCSVLTAGTYELLRRCR